MPPTNPTAPRTPEPVDLRPMSELDVLDVHPVLLDLLRIANLLLSMGNSAASSTVRQHVATLRDELARRALAAERSLADLVPGYHRCGYCGTETVTHRGEYYAHSCPSETAARSRSRRPHPGAGTGENAVSSEAPATNPTNWTCDTETLSHRLERVAGRPETSAHDADVCRAAAHRMRRLYFGTDTERKYSERYTALSAKARNYKRQIKQLQGALALWRNVAENAIGRRIIDDLKRNPR